MLFDFTLAARMSTLLQDAREVVLHPRPFGFCQPSEQLVLGKRCWSAEAVMRDLATTARKNSGNSEDKDGLGEKP